jgi:flagellar hook assembly protein FlgD
MSVMPNPFNPSTEILFKTYVPGHVNIEVIDVSGRFVKTILLGIVEPGPHRARWDGRDANGADAASGVYFLRLRADEGESRVVKAVLVR